MFRYAPIAAVAATLLVAAPASAVTFTGGYAVNTNTSGTGLQVQHSNGSALNFTLNTVGQTQFYNNLFAIWTNETSVDGDDTADSPISVVFSFTNPLFTGTATGDTTGQSFVFGLVQNGLLTWDNGGVFEFAYGNGGRLGLTLTGGTFNEGVFGLDEGRRQGLHVDATFRLNAVPVPEPATWAMMIGGFGLVGAAMRRRTRTMITA